MGDKISLAEFVPTLVSLERQVSLERVNPDNVGPLLFRVELENPDGCRVILTANSAFEGFNVGARYRVLIIEDGRLKTATDPEKEGT